MSRFAQLGDRMFALYGEGDYEGALTVVDQEIEHLAEDDVPTATFWRICLLSRVGKPNDAIALMGEALGRGWWYGEAALRVDADLEPLHSREDWERLIAGSIAMQQATEPLPGLFAPATEAMQGSVIALHAAAGRATHTLKTWRPVTALGYDLFAPASSQLVAHDRGIWESIDQTIADVTEQATDKAGGPVIMAGRSQGAVRAAQIACSLDMQSV